MSEMKLTPKQFDLLSKICKTNGGGYSLSGDEFRVAKSLLNKGLIQGKAGKQYVAVHTREGLNIFRSKTEAEHE